MNEAYLKKNRRRVLFGCWWAYVMDGFDYLVLSLVYSAIMLEWGCSYAEAGAAGSATLIGGFIGCFVMGTLADKIGRKKSLVICLTTFGVFTVLCGFAQNLTQLIIFRFCAGTCLGAEWGLGQALAGEWFTAERRAKANSIVQTGWAFGYLFATLAFYAMVPTYGWRSVFFVGAITLLTAIYVGVFIKESPVYEQLQAHKAAAATGTEAAAPATNEMAAAVKAEEVNLTWKYFLQKGNRRTFLLATGLVCFMSLTAWGLSSWLPSYLTNVVGKTSLGMVACMCIFNVGAIIGYFIFGALADKRGRRICFLLGGLGSLIVTVIYLNISGNALLAFSFVYGLIMYGYYGPQSTFVSESFPAAVRGRALNYAFGLSRLLSALAPAGMGLIADAWGMTVAMYSISFFFLLTAVCAFFMKETKGRVA